MKYDALVVGSGIGGMESALKLGDMGYKVLVVEKQASVGGKMILLSKVFPTLDCASCISTPEDGRHRPPPQHRRAHLRRGRAASAPTATVGFHATIRQKPSSSTRPPAPAAGCARWPATSAVPDEFNADMVSRRAAYIAFPQAVPKKAVIDRPAPRRAPSSAPRASRRTAMCSLVRSGEYEKASPGARGDAAGRHARARLLRALREQRARAASLEGPLPIRRLKRFIADRHYGQAEPEASQRPEAERQAGRDRRLRARPA